MINSLKITIPSVIVSVSLGAINGYALAFWRFKGAYFFFGLCLFGAFIPYQVMVYPLLKIEEKAKFFKKFQLNYIYYFINKLICFFQKELSFVNNIVVD